jgi:hypothetical protein
VPAKHSQLFTVGATALAMEPRQELVLERSKVSTDFRTLPRWRVYLKLFNNLLLLVTLTTCFTTCNFNNLLQLVTLIESLYNIVDIDLPSGTTSCSTHTKVAIFAIAWMETYELKKSMQ